MTKLTKDQKALVEHAESLEGMNVRIEEEVSASGSFEFVTVTVDYDTEWYEMKKSVILMASRFEGERARHKACRMTIGMTVNSTKDLKLREVRSAVERLWLWNTEAGKQEQRRIDELFGR